MATINGTAGNDNLTGTTGADTINGLGGNDSLQGADGNDSVIGGAGNDTVRGNNGTDWVEGGAGNDNVGGGSGQDSFVFREAGTANADVFNDFASAWDNIQLDAAFFTALGSAGQFSASDARFWSSTTGTAHDADDRIIYNSTTRQLWYDADGNGSGAAQLIGTLNSGATVVATDIRVFGTGGGGGGSGQTINGTNGNDSLVGGAGNDTINGLAGFDTIDGGAGADSMIGGLDDDIFIVDNVGDIVVENEGGGSFDEVRASVSYTLAPWVNDLTLTGTAALNGTGNELDNRISASTGSRLEGLAGNDTLIGGTAQGVNVLIGGDGNDSLVGGRSGDRIDGGAGNDFLSDASNISVTYVFAVAPGAANADRIFNIGADTIELDARFYTNIGSNTDDGPGGRMAFGDPRFWTSDSGMAHDADDRLIFSNLTRELWYDADGSGAGARQLILTLEGNNGSTIGATSISIVNGSSSAGSTINGTAGNDSLMGTPGNDTINGFAGDDTINGGAGADSMVGGDHNDVYFVDNPADVIVEFENGGIDTVNASTQFYTLEAWVNNLTLIGGAEFGTGNELDNIIVGNGADNSLEGGFGNDTIMGGAGNDGIVLPAFSGGGFFQNPGNDSIDGGEGTDAVHFAVGDAATTDGAIVNLGAGTYSIAGPEGTANGTLTNIENVGGGYGDDFITGSAGANALAGNEGNDTVDGGAGNDTLSGFDEDGQDTFLFTVAPGASNADRIDGFTSADDQIVLDGAVHASSGATGTFAAGDARFWSSTTGTAHDADDRVIYNTGTGELWYDADGSGAGARQLIATLQGAPTLTAADIAIINGSGGGGGGGGGGSTINGTANADTLNGTAGNDTINGLGGNDAINASGGADVIDGGAGFDTIQYRTAATGPVVADFGAGTINGGVAGGSVSFSNIERVLAGDFNDQLTGNASGQNLTGQGGADTLTGAGGVDTLWGGAGNDVFVFREMGTANADRISDWASGADKVQLDDSAFGAIGALGNFAAGDGRFWAAAGATAGHDANDRVIFNSSTGSLYYDADGSGSGAAQLIGTVQSGAAVAATDIVVI